jgi:hypothetical protein
VRAIRVAPALVLIPLAFTGSGYASLGAPNLTGPADGSTAQSPSVFAWQSVSGADHYVFQLGGASGFNPFQYAVDTKNTQVALLSALQAGDYTWRVAAVASGGAQGPWSAVRSFTIDWSDTAAPQSPDDGDTIVYPEPLLLNWDTVPGAQEYRLTVSTAADLSTPVGGTPVTTAASAYALTARLPNGTYYWGVTPIDAQNHDGTPSAVYSFTYSWPNDTTLSLNDLDSRPEVFDPQFSWTAIPGAAYYKVDVNTDSNFPSGSNVCCTGKTVATSLTPVTLLPAAQAYYWRVTPYDSTGSQAGTPTVYTDGNGDPQTFTITYDGGLTAVANLSMRDSSDTPVDWPGDSTGVPTDTPIVAWDPVPGAASYEVQVSPYSAGICDWSTKPWDVHTASTAWTPLGSGHGLFDPWPSSHGLATDVSGLVDGNPYCVRVRAERNNDTANHLVTGSWTDIGDDVHPSFTYNYAAPVDPCDACTPGYLGAGDYDLPVTGTVSSGMPLFTWHPIAGYNSYYVVVATDDQFQNVVDYAWTRVPAYAPRAGLSGFTDYPDATYYWAVLPATGTTGNGVSARPDVAPPMTFQRQSDAPDLTSPSDGASIDTWPVFQWTPVDGAYDYHLQVATDQNFSNIVSGGDVKVDETSYTPASTYPANQTLYWRVQAEAKGSPSAVGLKWSAKGTFTKTLPVPSFTTPSVISNPATSDGIPVWRWNPVPGAVSYDITLTCPSGSQCSNGNGFDTTAVVATHLTGTKPLTWQVRANFPTVANGSPSSAVHGAYAAPISFQRTISAPANPTTTVANLTNFSMSWDPKAGAKQYLVEVSSSQAVNATGAFSSTVEKITTDTTAAAPTLLAIGGSTYLNGGTLYWHVAAKDADGNVGSYTSVQTLTLPAKLVATSSKAALVKKVNTSVTITVKSAQGSLISNASVKVSGAGVATKTQKTGAHGTTTFKLHPTKKGKVTVTATKSGAQTATMTITVS